MGENLLHPGSACWQCISLSDYHIFRLRCIFLSTEAQPPSREPASRTVIKFARVGFSCWPEHPDRLTVPPTTSAFEIIESPPVGGLYSTKWVMTTSEYLQPYSFVVLVLATSHLKLQRLLYEISPSSIIKHQRTRIST